MLILIGLLSTLIPLATASLVPVRASGDDSPLRIRLTITTPLTYANTPLDPVIDFSALIRKTQFSAVLDPSSIAVIDLATGRSVPHSFTEDYVHSDRGRVEFVVTDPSHREFEIRAQAVVQPPPGHSTQTPPIGTGDLLRYNSGRPGPITLFHSMGLHDVTGDGRPDLVGSWNYYYRPGDPTGGIVFYPSTSTTDPWLFGNLARLQYKVNPSSSSTTAVVGAPKIFSHHYNAAAFADFNGDQKLDFVYTRSGVNKAELFIATDERSPSGAPVYVASGTISVSGYYPCRVVDLNADGKLDLVVNGEFIENAGSGWPFESGKRVQLDAGVGPALATWMRTDALMPSV